MIETQSCWNTSGQTCICFRCWLPPFIFMSLWLLDSYWSDHNTMTPVPSNKDTYYYIHTNIGCAWFMLQVPLEGLVLNSAAYSSPSSCRFACEQRERFNFIAKTCQRACGVKNGDRWIVCSSAAAPTDSFLNNIDNRNYNLCSTAVDRKQCLFPFLWRPNSLPPARPSDCTLKKRFQSL